MTEIGDDVPRTPVPFPADPDAFRFVLIGDRTGGHRPDVFENAVAKVNLLRPDFVVNVGDLIEGYTDDPRTLDEQWSEVEHMLEPLEMPFFYVPGNHDLSNDEMVTHWRQRHGATYYRFVHRDVLFLVLNTEDPPVPMDPDILARTRALEEAMALDPEGTQARVLEAAATLGEAVRLPGRVNISDEQLAFVQASLAAHADVRWTFVLMHRPAWMYDSPAFDRIEGWLQDRDYTVVAGHEHYYAYDSRNGRDYIDMATTGGVWLKEGPGRLDHVAWVTMTASGPVLANLRIDGILDKRLQ